MSADSQSRRSMKAVLFTAWILLLIWIAWTFQSNPSTALAPRSKHEDRDNAGRMEAGAPEEVIEVDPRIGREPVRPPIGEGLDSDEQETPDRVVPLDKLPPHLSEFLRNRLVPNINIALRAEGLEELDVNRLETSVSSAQDAMRRYREVWDTGDIYDKMMEERVDALMAAGGPGTGVIDVSDWPAITVPRMNEELTRLLGRDIKEIQRNDRTIIRWRKEGSHHVRYGVFEPGMDSALDSLHDSYDRHFNSTIRFSLIDLGNTLRRE